MDAPSNPNPSHLAAMCEGIANHMEGNGADPIRCAAVRATGARLMAEPAVAPAIERLMIDLEAREDEDSLDALWEFSELLLTRQVIVPAASDVAAAAGDSAA